MSGDLAERRARRVRVDSSSPALFGLFLILGFTITSPALGTCGSSTCFLVTGTQEGTSAAHSLRIDLSFRYVDQSRRLSGTKRVSEVITPGVNFEEGTLEPGHHREISTRSALTEIDLSYGVTERLSVVGSLPLFTEKDHEHFDDVGTPEEHFSGTDGSRGFGDVQVGARYGFLVRPKTILLGGLVVKMPTGDYRRLDSQGSISEPGIQPGTGSSDFIGSLGYSYHPFPSPSEWFASASYRANGENNLRYRMGDEAVVSTGLRCEAGSKLIWSAQLNVRHTQRDRFHGGDVPSTGATYLNVTPGVTFKASAETSLYGFVQVLLHQRVNEEQLAPRSGFVVGVSRIF